MTKEEKVKKWIKKHDICGDSPWFDRNNTYYNLTAKQIVNIATYLNKI